MVDYKKDHKNLDFTFIDSGKVKSKLLNKFLRSIKNLKFGELILNSISNDGTGSGLDLNCIKNMINTQFSM